MLNLALFINTLIYKWEMYVIINLLLLNLYNALSGRLVYDMLIQQL